MAVCVLGDIHFRDDKEYFVDICNRFLDWYKSWRYNTPENTLILAGDLVERAVLSGRTAEFLERFARYSLFDKVHIVVGNHDIKRQYGVPQLAYHFYQNKPKMVIHSQAESFRCENLNVLALPHILGLVDDLQPMVEYYSNLYKQEPFASSHYDLAVGHFCMDDMPFAGNEAIHNLDKLNIDKLILGHIHTRSINPECYIGSVFAGKKGENDRTRAAMIYESGTWVEDPLPIFDEFLDAYYPDPLPKSDAIVPIYTVYNCTSENAAIDLYGEINIRHTVRTLKDQAKKDSGTMQSPGFVEMINQQQMLKEFLESKKDLDPNVKAECTRIMAGCK